MKPKIVKAFKQGDSIVMIIPVHFTEELDIDPGEFLRVYVKKHRLCIEKALPVI